MQKVALFVFNGDPMCFIHVLLNALDMYAKGYDSKIVIEGASTSLLPELAKDNHPLNTLWKTTREKNRIAGVCKACARKMNTLDAAKDQGLELLEDMNGHPSMAAFREAGYEIITF